MTLVAEKQAKLKGTVEVLSAAAPDGPRRFRMVAYTGAEFARFYGRCVADLSGLSAPAKLPILVNHNEDAVAGYADSQTLTEKGLVLEGPLLTDEPAGARIARLSASGFPLTASIGVDITQIERLNDGQTAKCNGQTVTGPLTIWRKASLFETSFVTANPADKNTSAAALTQESPMTPEEFLKANPDAVKAWRDEAAKAAGATLNNNLAELLRAFPDREKFALEQFAKGSSLLEAKAALCDVLQAEKAAAPVPAPSPAGNPILDALKQKAGNPGVGFDGNAREGASLQDSLKGLPPAERAKAELAAFPELEDHGITVAALTAFHKAERRGQIKSTAVTRAAAVMTDGSQE